MLGLALGAAKMIGGGSKVKAGKGARVAKNMMGRGGKDNGGGSALVARPSSSIVPRPAESTAIVKAPKAKRTYVRLGMEGHLVNIRESVNGIDDYLKGTIAAQKKEIDDKKKKSSENRKAKQEQKLEKPKKNQKFNMKGMKMPKTGFLDGVFNFISNVLMGMLVLKLMEFGGAIEKSGVLQFIGKAADFVLKFGGKLLDGLMTFIDKSYQLYDSLGDNVAKVFGEDGRKAFDDFSSGLNKVLNATIAIALVAAKLSGGMSKIPVNKALKKVPGKNLTQKKKLLRRYISRNGRKAAERRFGKAAVQQLGGKFARSGATNLARQTLVNRLGKRGAVQLLKNTKTFISPIVKRIPLIGALIDFALNYFVFKEPIGRAAFMAIGAGLGTWVGGLLGTAIPIPFVGSAIGAFLGAAGGDILGGAIYDMIFGGQSEDAASQTVAAEGKVTGGQDTGGGGEVTKDQDTSGGSSGSPASRDFSGVESNIQGSKKEKWKAVSSLARQAGAKYPQLVAAQFALESAWGTALAARNNYFGIKAIGSESATVSNTREVINGQSVYVDARFKNFKTPFDAINHLVNQWYKDYKGYKGVNNASDKYTAAMMLKSEGYATDPIYANSLTRLMNEYNVAKFEGGGYVGGKYDMNQIKSYASYEAGNSDPIVIPLPLPQQSQASQMYEDNQQMATVISGGERSNPFEFLDFQG
jgi:flagellum-specific peptidoglycan hydrolase FlgJ